ncbi:MAG: type II secretion system F family protein [Planctomycetia bacterium]|nr:type II secretion system F family protein [Planctomycetia bacterium]
MSLLIVVIFAAAVTGIMAVGLTVRDLSTRRYDRVDRRLGIGSTDSEPQIGLEPAPPKGRVDRSFQRLVEDSGTRLDPALALALVSLFALLGCGLPLVIWDNFLFAAGGLVIGALLPVAVWSIQGWRRRAAIARDLPETLDLLADGVRSGRTFEQAAAMVATDLRGPLADEFAHCAAQMRLGHSPAAVLDRMMRRVPLAEFKMFAVAVTVHRQTGGNLALLTERLAAASRDRQQFNGHLAAVTAGGRLSAIGLIVGSLLGVAVLMWIQPEYIGKMMSNRLGPPLLTIAVLLEIIGAIWLWRILRVKF